MIRHPLVLVDRDRLTLFARLAQSRRLFLDATDWIDGDGVAWRGARVGAVAIGLSSFGPSWIFDAEAREARAEEYRRRLQLVQSAGPKRHRRELDGAIEWLRLGRLAERAVWAIHAALMEQCSSLLTLPDTMLGEALWGLPESRWPRGWRQVVTRVLGSLSWLHVAPWPENARPDFGDATALVTAVGDLRGTDDDVCPDDCPAKGGARHHHYQIDVGPGFLGLLEQFGRPGETAGERRYAFPVTLRRRSKEPTLRAVGKTGQLVPLFLPAKLGDPLATTAFNAAQHRLLQAIVRETTRATREKRSEGIDAEIVAGNTIRAFSGQKTVMCALLSANGRYVGFNGNKKRRGQGYRLATWLAKADYVPDRVATFLDDLNTLKGPLGLTVIGIGPHNQIVSLDRLRHLAASPRGLRQLERFHLRVYSGDDYIERWSGVFMGARPPEITSATPADDSAVIDLRAAMKSQNVSLRALAAGIGKDPSFLSKLMSGKKPWPAGCLDEVRRWVEAQPAPALGVDKSSPTRGRAAPKRADILNAACALLERGVCALPQIPGAKKPAVLWTPFQTRLPTRREWETWSRKWPDAGLLIVLGPISGLFVIDVDGADASAVLEERLGREPLAPKVLSGSGELHRYHLYFRHPELPTRAKQTPWHEKLEFRGRNGLLVVPPSLHRSGNRYSWAEGRSLDDLPLPDAPRPVLDALKPVPAAKTHAARSWAARAERAGEIPVNGIDASSRTLEFLSGKFSEGPRWNDRLFQAACDLHGRSTPFERAEPLLLRGAQPWSVGELELASRTIASAFSQPREPGRR